MKKLDWKEKFHLLDRQSFDPFLQPEVPLSVADRRTPQDVLDEIVTVREWRKETKKHQWEFGTNFMELRFPGPEGKQVSARAVLGATPEEVVNGFWQAAIEDVPAGTIYIYDDEEGDSEYSLFDREKGEFVKLPYTEKELLALDIQPTWHGRRLPGIEPQMPNPYLTPAAGRTIGTGMDLSGGGDISGTFPPPKVKPKGVASLSKMVELTIGGVKAPGIGEAVRYPGSPVGVVSRVLTSGEARLPEELAILGKLVRNSGTAQRYFLSQNITDEQLRDIASKYKLEVGKAFHVATGPALSCLLEFYRHAKGKPWRDAVQFPKAFAHESWNEHLDSLLRNYWVLFMRPCDMNEVGVVDIDD